MVAWVYTSFWDRGLILKYVPCPALMSRLNVVGLLNLYLNAGGGGPENTTGELSSSLLSKPRTMNCKQEAWLDIEVTPDLRILENFGDPPGCCLA